MCNYDGVNTKLSRFEFPKSRFVQKISSPVNLYVRSQKEKNHENEFHGLFFISRSKKYYYMYDGPFAPTEIGKRGQRGAFISAPFRRNLSGNPNFLFHI